MKDYIVTNTESDNMHSKHYLSRAKSKKEAIDKVYREYGYDHSKKVFTANTIDDFYKNSDSEIEGLACIFA